MSSPSSIVPLFTRESAILKVRTAEDGWNSRDPQRVSLAYSVDSRCRNRSEFINGREEIVAFLTRKWSRELEYRLIKELCLLSRICGWTLVRGVVQACETGPFPWLYRFESRRIVW